MFARDDVEKNKILNLLKTGQNNITTGLE